MSPEALHLQCSGCAWFNSASCVRARAARSSDAARRRALCASAFSVSTCAACGGFDG